MLSIGSSVFEERPIIFFDSHPEPPAGIVWDSLSRLKKQLATAWTGDVVLDVQPGLVRLQWWTTDGKFGKKDYELREYEDARTGFEKLCTLEDVSRAMIVGYPSQNPYSLFGDSEYAINEKRKAELLNSSQYKDFVPKQKIRKDQNVGHMVEQLIDLEDEKEREQEKRRAQVTVKEDV